MEITDILNHYTIPKSLIHGDNKYNILSGIKTPSFQNPDERLIQTMDILEIPEDIKSLVLQILSLENYKKNILSALEIPKDVDPVSVLQTLIDMEREVVTVTTHDGKQTQTMKLHFNDSTRITRNIITHAIYALSGIDRRNILEFSIVNSDGEPLEHEGECDINELSQTCEIIFSKYQNSYIVIDGNLDAKVLKKHKFDFSYLPRIVVTGDFTCIKENKIFPYQVDGTVFCRGLGKKDKNPKHTDYITSDVILPLTHKIDCAYSFSDLDVFTEILPILPEDTKTTLTLVVQPDLVRSKSLKDPKYLQKILDFITNYPYITIVDTDGNNLLDTLVKIVMNTDSKKQQKVTKPVDSEPIQTTLEPKIPEKHMDIRDILNYCHTKNQFDGFSDDDLDRLIRNVLSNQRQNGIKKQLMRRDDGAIVSCIAASQKDLVIQEILKIANERENKDEVVQETDSITPKALVKPETIERKAIRIKDPVKIQKYITPALLKQIEKSSPQNVIPVLHAIEEINLNPLDMRVFGPVHMIKDDAVTVSPTVVKENGCCLVQSVDSSNYTDPKRIIWQVADGPNGLIFVCKYFLPHHNTQNTINLYAELRKAASKLITYTEADLEKYINVRNIINGCYTTTEMSHSSH